MTRTSSLVVVVGVIMMAYPAVAQEVRELYVAPIGDETADDSYNCGNVTRPCASLENAANQVLYTWSNATIHLLPGTHNGTGSWWYYLNHLTIKGADAGSTAIDCFNDPESYWYNTVFYFDSINQGIQLQDLTMRNCIQPISLYNSHFSMDRVRFENVGGAFEWSGAPISVYSYYGSYDLNIQDVEVTNTRSGNYSGQASWLEYSTYESFGSEVNIDGLIIVDAFGHSAPLHFRSPYGNSIIGSNIDISNSLTQWGGAIRITVDYPYYWSNSYNRTFTNTYLYSNEAEQGGAVYTDAPVTFENSIIANNYAFGDAGGVFLSWYGDITFNCSDTAITGNQHGEVNGTGANIGGPGANQKECNSCDIPSVCSIIASSNYTSDTCSSDCFQGEIVIPVCGNGAIEGRESCDDGNLEDGDGCDSRCVSEVCGNGKTQPGNGEECDDGNTEVGDGCDAECIPEVCGNGKVQFGEECDDSNTVDGDDCDSECIDEECGNGKVQFGEECDDGNRKSKDGCDKRCEIEPIVTIHDVQKCLQSCQTRLNGLDCDAAPQL